MITLENVTNEEIRKHRPMVCAIARRLIAKLPYNVESADLEQAGLLAVAIGIGRFDAAKASFDTKSRAEAGDNRDAFLRFMSVRIEGAMIDVLRDEDHYTRDQRRTTKSIESAESWLLHRGERLTMQAVAERAGITQSQVRNASIMGQIACLSEEDYEHNLECLTDDISTEDEVSAAQQLAIVKAAVKELPSRYRQVLDMRHDEDLDLKAIGKRMGVTESRVCQMYGEAIAAAAIKVRAAAQSKKARKPDTASPLQWPFPPKDTPSTYAMVRWD